MKILFQVLWMLYNYHGEMSMAYRRYCVKKKQNKQQNKKRNFGLEALKITFLHYGPHWGCWIIFILLITWTVSLQRVLSIFLAFVILMEVLQFWLYPSRHFKFIENWIELLIVLLSKWAYKSKPGIQLLIFRFFILGLDLNIYSGFKPEIYITCQFQFSQQLLIVSLCFSTRLSSQNQSFDFYSQLSSSAI